MRFFQKLRSLWRKDKRTEVKEKEERNFFEYIQKAPYILTWKRRENGISRKNLQLTIIDNEEEPFWKIAELVRLLSIDINLMYLLTDRKEAFQDIEEEAFQEKGLLIIRMNFPEAGKIPGNLVLDVREWKNQLDQIEMLS